MLKYVRGGGEGKDGKTPKGKVSTNSSSLFVGKSIRPLGRLRSKTGSIERRSISFFTE